MAEQPDIIKLFHEEPFYLEALPPDEEPDARRQATELGSIDALLPGDFSERPEPHAEDDFSEDALDRPTPYYRVYLAGTDLKSERIGATAIRNPAVWAGALVALFPGAAWWSQDGSSLREHIPDEVPQILTDSGGPAVIVASDSRPFEEVLTAVRSKERREATADLKRLLDDAEAVFLREPAHHGHDWSIFSRMPIRDRLEETMATHLVEGVRAFVAPYQKARSEERFYFERWALEEPPEWTTELRQDHSSLV